jgi:6-phosphogluconolactonase
MMRNNASQVLIFPDLEAASRAAAERFVRLARTHDPFSVALSGGHTPRPLYRMLAAPPYQEQVPWPSVHVFWGDERAVPPQHPESNYRMASETLLDHVPIPDANIHRVLGEKDPQAAAEAYAAELERFFGTHWPRFDLVLLGMGKDGHTASLFPGSDALQERHSAVLGVAADYEDRPAQRVTLTVPSINAARNVMFLVTGADKAETVHAILSGSSQPRKLPAQLIQPSDGELLWLLDEAAAVQIQDEVGGPSPS